MRLGWRLPLWAYLALGWRCAKEDGRQPQNQGQVGDIVDQAILKDGLTLASCAAHLKGKDQVRKSRAVRHDQGAQHSPFKPLALYGLKPPDHEGGSKHEQAYLRDWIGKKCG